MKFFTTLNLTATLIFMLYSTATAQFDPFSSSSASNFYLTDNSRWQNNGTLPKANIYLVKGQRDLYSQFVAQSKLKSIRLTIKNLRDSIYTPVFESIGNYSQKGLLTDSCVGDYPVSAFMERLKNGVIPKTTPDAPMVFASYKYKDGQITEATNEWHAAAPAFNITKYTTQYKDGKLQRIEGKMYNYYIQENAIVDSSKPESERIELYELMPDSSNISWKYFYNKDGSLRSVKQVDSDGKTAFTLEMLVDRKGYYLFENKIFLDNDGNSITQKTEYIYDINGKLTQFSYIEETGERIIRNYKYNSKGELVEERLSKIWNKKKELSNWCTYFYDNQGLLKKVYNYNNADKLTGTESYEYNTKKQLVKFDYHCDNEYDNYFINYLYDAKGNLSTKEVYKQKEKESTYNYVYEYYN